MAMTPSLKASSLFLDTEEILAAHGSGLKAMILRLRSDA
jgi:hypothetical protein